MDRVALHETVGPRAVLADERAVPAAEHRGGGRTRIAVRREDEAETTLDDALRQQTEEAARLHRDAEPATGLQMERIEGVERPGRGLALDPDARLLRVHDAASVVPSELLPERLRVRVVAPATQALPARRDRAELSALLHHRPLASQPRELHLDRKTVKEVDNQYLREQVQRVGTLAPRVLGIDEIAIRKGHPSGSAARIARQRAWTCSMPGWGPRKASGFGW